MSVRDLISRNRSHEPVAPRRSEVGHPLFALQRDIERVFDDFWRGFDLPMMAGAGVTGFQMPSVDVAEDEKTVRVTADLPGLEEKDIDVTFADNVLTLRGERKEETKRDGEHYRVMERSYGTFERLIPVHVPIDADKVTANFQNGVLTVVLPKAPEAQKPVKRIAVNRK